MRAIFKNYDEAKAYAQAEADADGGSRGIEVFEAPRPSSQITKFDPRKTDELYRVFRLPPPSQRFGHELRAECVDPTDWRQVRR